MSSHREAPEISKDPVADNTDVYAFVSPDKPDTVTLIANYIPLEDPAGGPNFFSFGDDVLYEINIDNGRKKRVGSNLQVPPVNVGDRSTGLTRDDYEKNLGSRGVQKLDNGGMVFAGQRDDPFFVDLGSIFDLGGLRPFNSFHVIPLPTEAGRDHLQGLNVHSIVVQVP